MEYVEPNPSLWMTTSTRSHYPPLSGDGVADVVVVGGGITGLTAAWLLQRQGRRVVLVEMHRIAVGETGHTTSHLTELTDRRYHVLESKFGRQGAHKVADSSRAAIELIAQLSSELGVDCGFERVPAFLYTEREAHIRELEKEVEAAQRVGLVAQLTRTVPLPFPVKLAIRVENQAQVHPREYLLPLAAAFVERGGRIHEMTRVLNVHDGAPCVVETEHGTLRADSVVVAANVPVNNKVFLITKIAPYRTYVVAAKLEKPFPPGLFWDTEDPYHYTRRHLTAEGEYLIVGGEDHKVGKEDDTEQRYAKLAAYVRERFGLVPTHRWSGQIIEPVDGLPFIGLNSASRHVYVATGYSGTGMTFGTVGGMVVSDLIAGRPNPWADLYDATRVRPLAQAKDYIAENLDFPAHLIRDRFQKGEVQSLAEVPRGEGRLMQVNGRMLAVARDEDGEVHAVSAVCKHMGCHVGWNTAEKTWDCPCHGSRFDPAGQVLNGPATQGLEPVEPSAPPLEAEEGASPQG
jgi:glycine/D-amino acid oxidase-like deaminating enzyme/nitrite reductase/ring-hydroxylating ferredoxin subunit